MLNKKKLIEYFEKGIKNTSKLKIGTEHEKFILNKTSLKPLIYDEKDGILDVFKSLIDLGCGGGHFLKALELKKIQASGFETSKELSKLGNKRLKKNKIFHIDFEEIYDIIKASHKANVLSLIGALEHLVKPEKIMKSFVKSKIKYLYISVPLFSLSTFIENSFPNVFPRQLSGGHTHLYTEKSLAPHLTVASK